MIINPSTYKYNPWEVANDEEHLHSDLMAWQCMFDWHMLKTGCPHWGEDIEYCLDGYSQCEWLRSGGVDKQVFMDDEWINLFVADIWGGVAIRINRKTENVEFWAIGEDDGSWFLTDNLWIKNLEYWKGLIMSEISELHIPDFDHQKVIEKVWNWSGEIKSRGK